MQYKYPVIVIILLLLSISFGCKKNVADLGNQAASTTGNQTPVATVTIPNGQISVTGTVYNENHSPLNNATVTVGAVTLHTDATGTYNFSGAVADTDKVVIKVNYPGYYNSWRTIVVENNSAYSHLDFSMEPDYVVGTFNAAAGGAASCAYVTFTFPANGISKEDGTAYTGQVSVIAFTDTYVDNRDMAPGDRRAIDAANNRVVMEHVGVFAIKLKGQSGENLSLSKPMKLTFNAQFANVINSLKLWAFDETDQTWKESGVITGSNNAYTASVTTLSFFELAIPHPWALLRTTVLDANQTIPVGFSLRGWYGAFFYGVNISSKGVCSFYAPADRNIYLVLNSPCNDRDDLAYFTITALPAGVKTNRTCTFSLSKYISVLSGKVLDCSFQPVNGRAELNLDGIIYQSAIVNGAYTFKTISCGVAQSSKITVYDNSNNILTKNVAAYFSPGTTVQLPVISACGKPQTGTVTITAEGKTYIFSTPKDSIKYLMTYDGSNNLCTAITVFNGTQSFYITSINTTVGTYPVYTCSFVSNAVSYFLTFGFYTPGKITYTKYNSGNTIVAGTFQTTISKDFSLSNLNTPVSMSGSFEINQ